MQRTIFNMQAGNASRKRKPYEKSAAFGIRTFLQQLGIPDCCGQMVNLKAWRRSRDVRDIGGHTPLPSGSDCARRRRCRCCCIIHSDGVSDVRLTMFPRVVAARLVDLQRISRCSRCQDILPQDRATVTDVSRGRATRNSSRSNVRAEVYMTRRGRREIGEHTLVIDFPTFNLFVSYIDLRAPIKASCSPCP